MLGRELRDLGAAHVLGVLDAEAAVPRPVFFATRAKMSKSSAMALSPIAWISTWRPAASAPAMRSSIFESGIASAA